jgi:hypothetical protein
MSLKRNDYWLICISVVLGMTLVFVLLSTEHNTFALTILCVVASIFLLAIGFGVLKPIVAHRKKEILEYLESAAIPRGSRVEISFEPEITLRNPRLSLLSKSRGVQVEEVWFHEHGSLTSPQPIDLWGKGVYYRGVVNQHKRLTVLISNNGPSTANIVARLVGYKDNNR